MHFKATLSIVSTLAFLFAAADQPKADDSVTVKLAHPYPANHYLWEHGGKVFAEAVETKTAGKVSFEIYPAQQLGKAPELLKLVGLRTADMGIIAPTYVPDKLPLSGISELPMLANSSCEATYRQAAISQEGGMLDTAEYAPNDIYVLFVATLPQYGIVTTSAEVVAPEDVDGLKIRATGAGMSKSIRALGGVPIQLTSMDMYDSATRGTIDGSLISYNGIFPYDLQNVFKHSLEGVGMGAPTVMYTINRDLWNSFSEDIQGAMKEAATEAQREMCSYMDSQLSEFRTKLVEEYDFKIVELSDDQKVAWEDALSPVIASWLEELESNGKDGKAILEAYRNATLPDWVQ